MTMRFTITELFIALTALVSVDASAQPNVTVRPFVVAGEIRGDVSTNGVSSDFSQGFGNGFEKGNGAVGVDIDVHGDSIGSLSQLWFTSLADTATSPEAAELDAAEQNIDATFFTQTVGFALYSDQRSFVDVTIGGRLASVENSLTLRSKGIETEDSDSRVWVDPVVGLNAALALSEIMSLRFGGDIGGFSTASDVTWQGWSTVGVRLSRKAALALGYRAISHSFDDRDFTYDVTMRGPTLGLDFSF